ncbi:MarR family winged helix-turn-helix transcriptional regulator [Profundibacter sp.]
MPNLNGSRPEQLLAAQVSHGFTDLYQQKFGISLPEGRIAAHLSQAGPISVREFHQRVDMDKSKVSRATARLEVAGYVSKSVNDSDRKLVELELTRKGRNMIAELAPIAQEYEQRVLAALGEHALCFRTALDTLLGEKEIK